MRLFIVNVHRKIFLAREKRFLFFLVFFSFVLRSVKIKHTLARDRKITGDVTYNDVEVREVRCLEGIAPATPMEHQVRRHAGDERQWCFAII